MGKKRLPKFRSEEEEALFWSKHSPLDYPEEFAEIEEPIIIDPDLVKRITEERKERKRSITFRIEPSKIALVKIIAGKQGSGYQTLMRMWINDKIYKEIKTHPEIIKELKEYDLMSRKMLSRKRRTLHKSKKISKRKTVNK